MSNDERNPNDECRIPSIADAIPLQRNHCSFWLRNSSFLRHWVFRHSSLTPRDYVATRRCRIRNRAEITCAINVGRICNPSCFPDGLKIRPTKYGQLILARILGFAILTKALDGFRGVTRPAVRRGISTVLFLVFARCEQTRRTPDTVVSFLAKSRDAASTKISAATRILRGC